MATLMNTLAQVAKRPDFGSTVLYAESLEVLACHDLDRRSRLLHIEHSAFELMRIEPACRCTCVGHTAFTVQRDGTAAPAPALLPPSLAMATANTAYLACPRVLGASAALNQRASVQR